MTGVRSSLLRFWLIPYGLAGLAIGLFLFSFSRQLNAITLSVGVTLFISGASMLGSYLFHATMRQAIFASLSGTVLACMVIHVLAVVLVHPIPLFENLIGLYLPSLLLTTLAIFLSLLLQELRPKGQPVPVRALSGTFTFRNRGEDTSVDLHDLVWIRSHRNRVVFHTAGSRSYTVWRPLKEIVEELPRDFIRIHKQYAVRLDHIVSSRRLYGQLFVMLSDGEELPVGRLFVPDYLSRQRELSG